jgi:hypothetical protein
MPSSPTPNERRVAAGKRNRLKQGPLTPEGRERLRQAALLNRPWLSSTGPKTPQGKAQAAANGKARQRGAVSEREVIASLTEEHRLAGDMAAARRLVSELLSGE